MKKLILILPVLLLCACGGPKTSDEWVTRGEGYHKDGDMVRAIASFNRAERKNPLNTRIYASRGTAYFFIGDYERAVRDFEKVIENDPMMPSAYSAIGTALFAGGNPEQALQFIDASIMLDPNNMEAFYSRGAINMALGNFDQAVNDYGILIQVRPFADAYRARAAAFEKLGKKAEAEADLKEAENPMLPQHINEFVGMAQQK